jgi:restriction endonuclease S subunit
MATNQGFKSFVPDRQRVHPKFLYYWLRKNRPYLESIGNGATFKEVSKAIISRIEVALPSLPEQRRIAAILDKADELRAKRRATLTKLDTLIRSIFLDMFGDPSMNPRGWPLSALGTLLRDVTNGMTRRRAESDAGQSIVLRLRDIREGWIDYSDVNRITLTSDEAQKYKVSVGDLLFIRVNGNPDYVGRCAFFSGYPENVYFNDHVMRVRADDTAVNGIFLAFLLNSAHGKREIAKHRKTSAGQHTINQDGLSQIRLPHPPLHLQQDFANVIAAIGGWKYKHEVSLLASDRLFASIQQRAFSGEL